MAPRGQTVEQKRLEILMAPEVLGLSVKAVCRRYGVSREQFYVWRRRYQAEGMAGLSDRSRRPKGSPGHLPPETERAVCQMRVEHPSWGPRRIRAELARKGARPPAKSTVQRALERNGLITPKPRKKQVYRRFERPSPNDLWQIDAIELSLAEGTKVYAINLLDDHARFLLASRVSGVLDATAAWAAFEAAASAHGLPRELISDNARIFSGAHWDVVVELERRLWALGVCTFASTPMHPQTLGKLERFHRTLREFLEEKGPVSTVAEFQRRLDAFRWHYNEERPHQGIADLTPAERYRATKPVGPDGASFSRSVCRKVSTTGAVSYAGWVVNITRAWAGATVEVIEAAGRVRILFGDEVITDFSIQKPKGYLGTGNNPKRLPLPRRVPPPGVSGMS
jgi:transposase InsO family protein